MTCIHDSVLGPARLGSTPAVQLGCLHRWFIHSAEVCVRKQIWCIMTWQTDKAMYTIQEQQPGEIPRCLSPC